VVRPVIQETTALGAAYLAGLTTGFWSNIDELKKHRAADTVFTPKADMKQMERLQDNWREAVARSRNWNKEDK
jgi:glycerol kinase